MRFCRMLLRYPCMLRIIHSRSTHPLTYCTVEAGGIVVVKPPRRARLLLTRLHHAQPLALSTMRHHRSEWLCVDDDGADSLFREIGGPGHPGSSEPLRTVQYSSEMLPRIATCQEKPNEVGMETLGDKPMHTIPDAWRLRSRHSTTLRLHCTILRSSPRHVSVRSAPGTSTLLCLSNFNSKVVPTYAHPEPLCFPSRPSQPSAVHADMSNTQLSVAHGRTLESTDISHLSLWQESVRTRPNALALISRHQHPNDFRWVGSHHVDKDYVQWSYSDLDRGARRLATALNRLTHIERRPIATLVNTQAEWAILYWAAAYLHSPLVPINVKTATRSEEIAHMFKLTGPAVVVCADATIATQLERSLSAKQRADIGVKIVLKEGGEQTADEWTSLSQVMSGDPSPPDTPDPIRGSDTTMVLFTSGTTSLPKPCNLSSFMCLNAAIGCMESREINHNHRFIQHLPNFHSYGVGWSLGFWVRGGLVILPSENFEAQASLECFELFKATHMGLVPTTAQAMLVHPYFPKADLSTLVSLDISGAGVLPSLIEACTNGFKVPAYTSYGMTESPGTLAWREGGGYVVRNGEVMSGMCVPGTTVKVCEPDNRVPVPRGQIGELHNGGPQVIDGYADPTVSSSNFYVDECGTRWIVTGDQAIMDSDGAVRITGRYKDMIIRGGENISPASIEDYLSKIHGVTAAQVVGVPDEMAGEVPIAVIVTAADTRVDINEIKQATSHDLGPAFAPKMVLHLKDDLKLNGWATTASGKVRKVELRASVREYLKAQEEKGTVDKSAPTITSLIAIWKKISGHDELRSTSTIQSFADSLMMMQLSSIVKKDLGRDITVEDFKMCDRIQDQADLIDSRPDRMVAVAKPVREGPPMVEDVPTAHGELAAYQKTKSLVEATVAGVGLDWDDVEDVVPLPDWDAIFMNIARPTSWNLRFVYSAPCTSSQLEAAIKQSLPYHPTMRSMAVEEDGHILLVTIRTSETWYNVALTTGWEVETKDDLKTLLLHHPELDRGIMPGPLVRMHIASVREDSSSGLVFVGTHAVHDASGTKLWLEDIVTILTGEGTLVPHARFRDYATAIYKHREGTEADNGVQYWTDKLSGVASTPESSFWPEQRAPEWFKGPDAGWTRYDGVKSRKGERTVAMEQKLLAQKGIRRMVQVQDIARLKSEHDVPVFMLVKAAIALLNVYKTGGKEAFFGTVNAARTWPFSSDYSPIERESLSDNPLDIAGCTTEYVLDRIPVSRAKSLIAFMQQVAKDEEQNSAFAHAPFFRIVDRLRDPLSADDTRTWAERDRDAEAILPLIRRQSFNWLPQPPSAQNPKGLKMMEMLTRMDNGLTITGFLLDDKKSVALNFSWDPEHLSIPEAERALGELVSLVTRLGQAEHWQKSVGELLRWTERAVPIALEMELLLEVHQHDT
nr:putative acyl-coa synthetase yngi [Quercus suber]